MHTTQFEHFASRIRELTDAEIANTAVLRGKFRIAQEGDIEVCYAPFEHINTGARLVIVGITPGMTQMENAMREAREQLRLGRTAQAVIAAAKKTAAFSGPMRPNLVALLDHAGFNRMVGVHSCEELFGNAAHLVQTTSVLRNPVFLHGENYNGSPSIRRTSVLTRQLMEGFAEEAQALPDALFVPLGDKVADALRMVADRGYLKHTQIFAGLPHPSPANVERIAYFVGRKGKAQLSSKTNAAKIDASRSALQARIESFMGGDRA